MDGQTYSVRSDIKIEYFEDPVVERVEMVTEAGEASDTDDASETLWVEVYGKKLFSSGYAHISMAPIMSLPTEEEGKEEAKEEEDAEEDRVEDQEEEKNLPQPVIFVAEYVEDKGCIRAKVELGEAWKTSFDEGSAKAACGLSINGVDEVSFAFPFVLE